MTLLYINDSLIDLYPNTVIAQTIQSFDITVGSLKTNYTNQIKVPKTPNNQAVFEFSENINSTTIIPYTTLTAKVIQNGIELLKNGKAFFKETDKDYSIAIYSGPFGFFDYIIQKKLWDLDFSAINSAWTDSARDGYRNTTTGIVCPVSDDGNLAFSSPNILITGGSNVRPPFIYYHTVFNQIIEDSGYTITGDILSDPFYLNMVMPLGIKYSPQFIEAKSFSAGAPGTQVMVDPSNVDVIFNAVSFNGADGFYNGTSRYVVTNTDSTAHYFMCQFKGRIVITVTGGTVDIELILNDGVAGSLQTYTNVGTGTYQFSTSVDQELADGDQVYIRIRKNTLTPTVTITEGTFYAQPKTSTQDSSSSEFRYTIVDDYVYFNHLFEDINQLDFIRDFCARFNVKITEVNGTLQCKSMNDILADTTIAVDWTNKRVKEAEKVRFSFGNLSQSNYFKYPGDSLTDDVSDDYAQGVFTIDNVNIPETATVYNSMFLKTQMTTYNNVFMAYISTNPVSLGVFANNPGIRLLLVRSRYASEPNVRYNVSNRNDYLVAYFIDPNQDYSMHWQYFLDNYYAEFVSRIQKTKVVTRRYYLTDVDIHTFNNLNLIHDNGSNFIVIKIPNYVSGRVSEVELLKV